MGCWNSYGSFFGFGLTGGGRGEDKLYVVTAAGVDLTKSDWLVGSSSWSTRVESPLLLSSWVSPIMTRCTEMLCRDTLY